jgi:hypothetical protein
LLSPFVNFGRKKFYNLGSVLQNSVLHFVHYDGEREGERGINGDRVFDGERGGRLRRGRREGSVEREKRER